jgi:hypothetical protein
MPKQPELPDIVSTNALCALLGYSATYVGKLVAEGVILKVGPGKFKLRESVQGALRRQSGRQVSARQSEALLKWTEERAEKARIQRQALQRLLVPVAEVERAWAFLVARTRTKLLSIPKRLAPRLGMARSAVEAEKLVRDEIVEALRELAANTEAADAT